MTLARLDVIMADNGGFPDGREPHRSERRVKMTRKIEPMGREGVREMPAGRPTETEPREPQRPDPKKRPSR